MATFPDTTFSEKLRAEKSSVENLDPLFLRQQSLSEDLRRWSALELRLDILEQETIAATDLKRRQVTILRLAALEGGCISIKALLSRMPVSKQNFYNNLTGLLRGDYARKVGKDPQDRRVHLLLLTEKGVAFVENLLEHRARLLRRAYRSADAGQVESFRRTLLLLDEEAT